MSQKNPYANPDLTFRTTTVVLMYPIHYEKLTSGRTPASGLSVGNAYVLDPVSMRKAADRVKYG